MFFNSKSKSETSIVEYSNVIQFDEMGYPLRLVINIKGEQLWLDTTQREDDVILKWERWSKQSFKSEE